MEKLYFEIPGMARKEDAIDYIPNSMNISQISMAPADWTGLLTTMKDGSKNWSRIIQEYQMKKKCLPGHSFWFGTRTGRLSA